MRRALLVAAALACAGCTSSSHTGAVVDELSADPARLDAEAPRVAHLAAGQGRNVLLYFHADWCEPCQTLKQAFRRAENRAALQKYFLVKVDVDRMPSTQALGLDVQYIPLLARLTKEGKVAGTLGGEAFGEHPSSAKVDAVLAGFLSGGDT